MRKRQHIVCPSAPNNGEYNRSMCGRYRLSRRKQLVEEYFDCTSDETDWNPRFNIAPTQPIPVIRQNPKTPIRLRSQLNWLGGVSNPRCQTPCSIHSWGVEQRPSQPRRAGEAGLGLTYRQTTASSQMIASQLPESIRFDSEPKT
jgi:hypothetical protein